MKSYPLLLTAILLTACARESDAPRPQAQTQTQVVPEPVAALKATESFEETRVIAAAAALVSGGGSLSAEDAERCWRVETTRPGVRAACILAWSHGSSPSASLSRAAIASQSDGPLATARAVAAVRRGDPLRGATLEEFRHLLGVLAGAPAWLRTRALRSWLEGGPLLRDSEAAELWRALPPVDEEMDPGEIADRFEIAFHLGREAVLIGQYCSPSLSGEVLSRCWRFLSATVNPVTRMGPSRARLGELPLRRDAGWTLFERSLPERAWLLQHYL